VYLVIPWSCSSSYARLYRVIYIFGFGGILLCDAPLKVGLGTPVSLG